jgi:hypothetical protein
MDVLDRFVGRVARLTPDERMTLAAATTPLPATEARLRWNGAILYALQYSNPEGMALIDRAYEISRPFDGTPLWDVIIDIGLCVAYPPLDPSVTAALLAPWRAVILDEPIDLP